MDWDRWPAPIRTLRGSLPAEMRVLRGAAGALGGAFVFGCLLVILLGGNWHLGYGDDRLFVAIYVLLVPAGLGIASPLWYWFGRPVWVWFDRPGGRRLRPLHSVRFLPGLAGSVTGVALFVPVGATSRLLRQTLAPFGLAIALGAPLWYWVFRPVGVVNADRWLPDGPGGSPVATAAVRTLLVLGVLFGVSLAITAAIALPVVGIGESVPTDGLAVTVTDVRTAPEIAELEDGTGHASDGWQFLLVRVSVENRGDVRGHLPGTSVGDFTVIAPPCRARTFGEPSHTCNQVFVDGPFRANGSTYANYETNRAAAEGTIAPGEHVSGWLAFRLESRPTRTDGADSMVIVDDVGRWTLGDAIGEDHREDIAIVEERTERVVDVADRARALNDIPTREPTRERVDLATVVDGTVADRRESHPDAERSVETCGDTGDRDRPGTR